MGIPLNMRGDRHLEASRIDEGFTETAISAGQFHGRQGPEMRYDPPGPIPCRVSVGLHGLGKRSPSV